MATNSVSKLSMLVLGLFWLLGVQFVQCSVTYDRKAILINGQRRVLFSGSIHYPRSTPEVHISPSFFVFLVGMFEVLLLIYGEMKCV